jgi:hypothetical protein
VVEHALDKRAVGRFEPFPGPPRVAREIMPPDATRAVVTRGAHGWIRARLNKRLWHRLCTSDPGWAPAGLMCALDEEHRRALELVE